VTLALFLKIDGIKGESTDVKHKDEIDIESFSWGVSHPGVVATGGGSGTGRPVFPDLVQLREDQARVPPPERHRRPRRARDGRVEPCHQQEAVIPSF